jgi:hypothetical protein
MITLLTYTFLLLTAYEIGKYMGLRDAERIFRSNR